MICINLTSDSQLFLTPAEATQLALDLTDQLQTSHEIIIADVRLMNEEGWGVLRNLSDAVIVNWKVEGF